MHFYVLDIYCISKTNTTILLFFLLIYTYIRPRINVSLLTGSGFSAKIGKIRETERKYVSGKCYSPHYRERNFLK